MNQGRRTAFLCACLGIACAIAILQICTSLADLGGEAGAGPAADAAAIPAPGSGSSRGAESAALAGSAKASAPDAADVGSAAAEGRKIVYAAKLQIAVANRETAHAALAQAIAKHGGFIQRDTGDTIVFRVRPEEFDAALKEAQGLGEIASREISTQDVTEDYTDLQLRIGVAEEALKRLQALMDKAGKLEDLLQVEAQIRKLTEEIETMKGKMRLMANRIDLCTIAVELLQRRDQADARPRRIAPRFAWLAGIGIDGALAPVATDERIKGSRNPLVKWGLGPRFKLATGNGRLAPDGFAELKWDGMRFVAATPEDWRIRATLLDVRQNAGLEFWGDALKEELAGNRGYLAEKIEAAPLKQAALKGLALRFATAFGGQDWKYDAWLIQRADHPEELLLVEFARTDKASPDMEKRVEDSVSGVDFRGTFLGM